MRRADWLLDQLPSGMVDPTDNAFFRQFVTIFQEVADTVLQPIDTLPHAFDPAVAPITMVREMGRWVGLDWLDEDHDPRTQRAIVTTYAGHLRMRGTKRGLTAVLELISGPDTVTIHDNGGVFWHGERVPQPPHVAVNLTCPGWTAEHDVIGWASSAEVLQIIRDELPATVTFELLINGTDVVYTSPGSAARAPAGGPP
jgi:phage tail-like protein